MTRYLDADLLADFEDVLSEVGASITRVWRPGLEDAAIDRKIKPFGIGLPEEARRWWRWHDGVTPETRGPDWDLTPGRPLIHLDLALEGFQELRGVMEQMDPSPVQLSPVGDAPWIYFACDGPADEPVPINVGSHGVETKVVLPSIGELVARWIELIQSGVFTTGEDGHWENTPIERVPDWAGRLGIH